MTTTPQPQKPITRVDIEAIGEGINRVSYWREGWQEGDPYGSSELVQKPIMYLLMDFEKQGFTCEMCDANHGRALRGKITRIDFVKILKEWRVRKYPFGWTAKTRPLSDVVKTEQQIQDAIAWCEQNGWNVHKNADGSAIAYKGAVKPVTDRSAILRQRRQAQREHRDYFTDFAYKP